MPPAAFAFGYGGPRKRALLTALHAAERKEVHSMKLIIPSKCRAQILPEKALRLFPDATSCAGDDEVDAYKQVTDDLLIHPAHVVG